MKLKTRMNNILGKIADKEDAKTIRPKTKDESLLVDISNVDTPFIITFSGSTINQDADCDKTWNEIKDACISGRNILARYRTTQNSGSGSGTETLDSYLDMDVKTVLSTTTYHANRPSSLSAYAFMVGATAQDVVQVIIVNCTITSSGLSIVLTNAGMSISK